jgi:hypothetical protein
MAAGKIYSNLYNSDGTPIWSKAKPAVIGAFITMGTKTIPTTSQDEENDTANMVPVPQGQTLLGVHVESGDQDAGAAADFDIVLVDPDAAVGDAPLATLWNSGTAFQAAVSKYIPLVTPVTVPRTAKGYCNVAQVVNTAAGTPAEQVLTVTVFGH